MRHCSVCNNDVLIVISDDEDNNNDVNKDEPAAQLRRIASAPSLTEAVIIYVVF